MILLGAGFQNHLTIAAFIIGWGLVEIATILNTTVVCEYQRPIVDGRAYQRHFRCLSQRFVPEIQGKTARVLTFFSCS